MAVRALTLTELVVLSAVVGAGDAFFYPAYRALFSSCLSPLGLLFAGALAGSIGVRETVLVGAGLSALSCLVVFVPGVRDPERADYAPVPLPEEASGAVVD